MGTPISVEGSFIPAGQAEARSIKGMITGNIRQTFHVFEVK
jgi:hypothetical protein